MISSDNQLLKPSFREGNGTPLQYPCLENPMGGGAWWAAVHGVSKSRTRLSDLTFTFRFHALEKEMATHSSVLASRIPEMVEPDGLPSMRSHRVGHNWSDLAAVAAAKPSLGFPGAAMVQNPLASAGDARDVGLIPGLGRSPGEGNGNHSSILAWKIPWTEEPGGLQSTGSQRVGHDWATECAHTQMFPLVTALS